MCEKLLPLTALVAGPSWQRSALRYHLPIVIGVWFLVFVVVLVLSFIIPLVGALCVLYQLLRHLQLPHWLSNDELEKIELKLRDLPPNASSNTVRILDTDLHRFLVPGRKQDGQVLLLLHGTFTSSFGAWNRCIHKLQDCFSILHIIDLPGFGRSACDMELHRKDADATVKHIVQILAEYIRMERIQPVVLGASIGAYVAGHLCFNHPDLINALILSSPAGVLPTLGKQGAYMTLLFKFAIPMLCCLGKVGLCIAYTYFEITGASPEAYYEADLRLRPRTINDLPRKFINISVGSAVWDKSPLLPLLLQIKTPLALIHGSVDTITPPHIGKLMSSLCGVPCGVVQGAWHTPEFSHPESFVVVLEEMLYACKRPCTKIQLLNLEVDWSIWRTPFVVDVAKDMLEELYGLLEGI